MTLIEKLAPYLPYGLSLFRNKETYILKGVFISRKGDTMLECLNDCVPGPRLAELYKPILKPMSDLLESDLPYLMNDHSTDYFADTDNYIKVMEYIDGNIFHHYTEFLPYGLINWLLKNHYDVFGMIESGEAIDINTLEK